MKLLGALFAPFVPGPLVSFLLLIATLTPDSVRAQDCVGTDPFVLGSVVQLPEACPDGSGPIPNTTCRWIEVSCGGMRPLRAQVRITEPTPGIAERGTVLLGGGAPGTGFFPAGAQQIPNLARLGFRVADRAWDWPDGWLTKEVGLRRQSCRYATLLSWLHDNVYTVGAFVAAGVSLGAIEIGYALTSWGMGSILDLAVPLSGPLTRLDEVCPFPPAPEWEARCLTIVPPGALTCGEPACVFLGSSDLCHQCSSAPTPEDLRADSIEHPDAVLDYPTTKIHFLFGQDDCSVAVPGGLNWAASITSEKVVQFVPNTPHGFGTPDGWAALIRAIDQDTMALVSQGPCVADVATLCLNGGRFEVRVGWRVPSEGRGGRGTAVPLTGDTGYFWFFDDGNVELVVKALDGRAVNGKFWVFYGALSNVEYSLSVRDTETGFVKTYFNPSGELASVADTSAFNGGAAAFGIEVAPSAASVDEIETRSAGELYALRTKGILAGSSQAAPCAAGSTTLCLNQGRFQVQVDWRVPSQGRSGSGRAVPVTGDTGYLWFFSEANVELIVKVLDGRPVNGHFWVFYGGLSDVEYTITVTDTQTGSARVYTNPSGTLASHGDTAAF